MGRVGVRPPLYCERLVSEQTSLTEGPALVSNNGADAARPSARVSIRDLADGQAVACAFVVRERDRRPTRKGDEYLRLVLADRTGSVPAVVWDDVEAAFAASEPGTIAHVSGRFSVHEQYGPQIKVDGIRAASPGEIEHDELVGGPEVPVEQLEERLRELLETIQTLELRELLDRFFGADSPVWARFREAPAAKYYHQAYRNGLLDHTVSVAQAVSAAASAFPGLDRDIAVVGALLHDIGKTMAYNDDPLAIDLTDAGRLQGEIPLGYYLVRREVERIEGFDPGLAQAIFHIVLSHHGALENGSPVIPATREATLVHAIDNLGGKLGSFDRIERALPDGETWSRFDRGIDSAAYFRERAA
jgi:3'-5' exoribonuclease